MVRDETILRIVLEALEAAEAHDADWPVMVDCALDRLGVGYCECGSTDGHLIADLSDGRTIYVDPSAPYGLRIG